MLWCVLVLLAGTDVVLAGPLEDVQAISGLKNVNAPALLRGDIFSDRGTQGSFPRGAYAESCYYIKAPVAVVGNLQLHGNPDRPREGGGYRTYSWPAPPDFFKRFQLSNNRPADRKLIDWTAALAQGGSKDTLHLDAGETDIIRRLFSAPGIVRDAAASAAWQQILQARNDAAASGGIGAVAAYPAGGVSVRASDEYRSLLQMTPGIAAHFAGITDAKPLFTGAAADEGVPYASLSDVNGHDSFNLGMMAARKGIDSWQVVDCTYYAADTFFVSLTLYQFSAWEGGTLVWEVDYISAPFRSYLGGVDRVFAGKELSKESQRGSVHFRRQAEGKAR